MATISELIIRSDVPVGVALSGGLDSSAVAALAAKKYPGSMHAFSVGYSGRPFYDERADAKALADHLSMPFHEVEISTGDMVDGFSELIGWRDDPIADISGYGYYAVMRAARAHNVPVMLQGQGGDELFWGYPWVRESGSPVVQKIQSGRNRHAQVRRLLQSESLSGSLVEARPVELGNVSGGLALVVGGVSA